MMGFRGFDEVTSPHIPFLFWGQEKIFRIATAMKQFFVARDTCNRSVSERKRKMNFCKTCHFSCE